MAPSSSFWSRIFLHRKSSTINGDYQKCLNPRLHLQGTYAYIPSSNLHSPWKMMLGRAYFAFGKTIFRGELLVLGRVTIGKPPTRWQGSNGRVVHFSFSNRSRFTQTQASNRHLAYQLLTRKSRNAPCWLFPSMLLTTKSTHVSIVPWSMLKKYHLKFFPPRNQHGSNVKPPPPTVGLLNPQVLEKTSRKKTHTLGCSHFQ